MENKTNIFDSLQEEIMQSDLPEDEKNRRLSALLKVSSKKINLMLVGSSGSGKSSTINALFDMSVAKVGIGVDPETKEIAKFDLGNLTIWDTPGLGDSVKNDKAHVKQIVKKLSEADDEGNLLIDLVLVVLDASSKDLAISYDVINKTLIPCLGKDNAHRILIGLNQSDMAMKGRNWNHDENTPNEILQDFLSKKAESVKRRIHEATGVTITPICYCAGYTDGEEKQNPYNLSKLLFYILMAVPSEKRLVLADKLNADEDNWIFNDGDRDYSSDIKRGFWESLWDEVTDNAEKGAVIGGCVLGIPGAILGGLVGGVVGGLKALVVSPFKSKSRPKSNILSTIFRL